MEPPMAATPPSLAPARIPTCHWSIVISMEASDWLISTHRTSDTEAEDSPDKREATCPGSRNSETSLRNLGLGLRLSPNVPGAGRICNVVMHYLHYNKLQ